MALDKMEKYFFVPAIAIAITVATIKGVTY